MNQLIESFQLRFFYWHSCWKNWTAIEFVQQKKRTLWHTQVLDVCNLFKCAQLLVRWQKGNIVSNSAKKSTCQLMCISFAMEFSFFLLAFCHFLSISIFPFHCFSFILIHSLKWKELNLKNHFRLSFLSLPFYIVADKSTAEKSTHTRNVDDGNNDSDQWRKCFCRKICAVVWLCTVWPQKHNFPSYFIV